MAVCLRHFGYKKVLIQRKQHFIVTFNSLSIFALSFRYNIQKPSHNVYIVDIHFAACFERNGDCLLNKTMVGGLEIPRSFCMSTNESEYIICVW